jgi:hypothetical protein
MQKENLQRIWPKLLRAYFTFAGNPNRPKPFAIPAQAGIQALIGKVWIPAFAGMTIYSIVHYIYRSQ